MIIDAGIAVPIGRRAASGVKVIAELLAADEASSAAEPACDFVVSPHSNVGAVGDTNATPGDWHGVCPLGVTRPLSTEIEAYQAESLSVLAIKDLCS